MTSPKFAEVGQVDGLFTVRKVSSKGDCRISSKTMGKLRTAMYGRKKKNKGTPK